MMGFWNILETYTVVFVGQIHQSVCIFHSIIFSQVGIFIENQKSAEILSFHNLNLLKLRLFIEQNLVKLVFQNPVVCKQNWRSF